MYMAEKNPDSSDGTFAWNILIERLESALTEVLLKQRRGLTEYELIKLLSEEPFSIFDANALSNQLSLFQTHFVLFHALYQLRDLWQVTHQQWLEISPLSIKSSLYSNNEQVNSSRHLTECDPLKTYYNDLTHLGKTSLKDVEHLLSGFWLNYLHPKQKQEALLCLNCTQTDDWPTIKANYRRLAMQNHPDRGGEHHQFTQVQQAYEILKIFHEQ